MFIRILKKDLKRKKTMNIILLLFIVLATMFVSSGLNNVFTVAAGTDYYMDKAGVGDYVVLTMGDNAVGNMEKVLEKEEIITGYRIESVIYGSKETVLLENGETAEMKNTALFQSIDSSALHFFDSENQEITEVKEGRVYATGSFMEKNNLEPGDRIRMEHSGTTLSLTLDGKAKDALFGSDLMANSRFLMNEADIRKLLENEDIANYYQGEIAYIDCENLEKLGSVTTNISNVAFDGPRTMIKMGYVMDMIMALLTLILSVCLMLVSFVVLKFSISFTIEEEFREIGIMKAIGISGRKIRTLYISKYLLLAVTGAVLGFFAGIPFGRKLIESVSKNMVLANEAGFFINIMGAALVVVMILLFAYRCTKKVKKITPVDAIRSGQTGERYKKKTVCRIGKSHASPSFYMAWNDVVSSPRRFFTIILSFFICTLFVLVIVNTTETMKSDRLIDTFGSRADLYITDVEQAMQDMKSRDKQSIINAMEKKKKQLEELGMPAKFGVEIQYKYKITFQGEEHLLCCQQGLNNKATDYAYTEGEIPQSANEIAITPQISELTGAKLGDVVTIDFGSEKIDCMVTAYYETMNQLGEVIRLHDLAPTSMEFCANILHYKVNFTDNPSEKEIESRKERLKKLYDSEDIMNAAEYCIDCIGVVDTMSAIQYLLLGITLVVVVLVTILMERAFIADERGQIAILKAIGFRSGDVIKWHTCRFCFVALIAVILAAIASIPMTKLCITPIFGMMGAKEISYNIVPWKIFLLYPGIVLLATLLVAGLTAQYTRKISSSDTAYIE